MGPMRRSNRKRRLLTAVLIAIAGCASAPRAEAAVSLVFQVADPEIGGYFRGRSADAERRLAQTIAALLNNDQELRFWSFADGSVFPQLQIRLTKRTQRWQYEVAVRGDGSGPPLKAWMIPWQTEADVERTGGFPPVAQLTKQIVDGFQDQFITQRRVDLLEVLRLIPLGAAVRLNNVQAQPLAILSLDWSRYQDLATSDFHILYKTQSGALLVLATGLGHRLAYPNPPPAEGLVVRLVECILTGGRREPIGRHLQEIRTGQPVAIYLARFDSLGAALSAAGGGLPPPAIAPRD
jgi:hypothetical protein